MNRCTKRRADILLYLDDALTGEKLWAFREHLETCRDCAASAQEEKALSAVLRNSRPLYSAPEALRARILAIASQETAKHHEAFRPRFSTRLQSLAWRLRNSVSWRPSWRPVAAGGIALLLGLVFAPNALRRVRANAYVDAATETHEQFLDGKLPLQCHSDSPEKLTAWFADKTPFRFQLPASQPGLTGRPAYRLLGARLVTYNGGPIALVAYETPTEKISLLVASSELAVVAGGEEVRAGNLTFHYRDGVRYEVITWSNHNLSYALVSSVSGSAGHSCLVCHQDLSDHVAVRFMRR